MPSSMIFASLVVLWLLILVPAVARHRQEVARPSVAALSGRVLARSPRRRGQEVDRMSERDRTDTAEDGRAVATRELRVPSARSELRVDGDGSARSVDRGEVRLPERRDDGDDDRRAGHRDTGHRDGQEREDVDDGPATRREQGGVPEQDDAAALDDDWAEDDDTPDDRAWERPEPRYRAGRGGFDAEAAALTARARYAFRQRVVLVMLLAAVGTGIVAGVASHVVWWLHAAVDVMLVGYLVYLRRQVRMEEAIRARRAARMAGTRRASAAEGPELDEWAEHGRDATRPAELDDESDRGAEGDDDAEEPPTPSEGLESTAAVAASTTLPEPAPSTESTSFPSSEARAVAAAAASEEERPALPRLRQTPLPPLPVGTTLVDDEDDDLDLDDGTAPGYRRAVGQ